MNFLGNCIQQTFCDECVIASQKFFLAAEIHLLCQGCTLESHHSHSFHEMYSFCRIRSQKCLWSLTVIHVSNWVTLAGSCPDDAIIDLTADSNLVWYCCSVRPKAISGSNLQLRQQFYPFLQQSNQWHIFPMFKPSLCSHRLPRNSKMFTRFSLSARLSLNTTVLHPSVLPASPMINIRWNLSNWSKNLLICFLLCPVESMFVFTIEFSWKR